MLVVLEGSGCCLRVGESGNALSTSAVHQQSPGCSVEHECDCVALFALFSQGKQQ